MTPSRRRCGTRGSRSTTTANCWRRPSKCRRVGPSSSIGSAPPRWSGPTLVEPSDASSRTPTAPRWPSYLIGGVLKADLHPMRVHSLKWDMLRADDFVLLRFRTTCSSGTTPAGSTAGSPSTRWPSRPVNASPSTPAPSTGTTPTSPGRTSSPTTATRTSTTCRPRSRAGTSTSSATGPCSSEWASARLPWPSKSWPTRSSRPARRPRSSPSSCPQRTP